MSSIVSIARARPAVRRLGLPASIAGLGVALAVFLAAASSQASARATPDSFADLAEDVAPAVVNIAVEGRARMARSGGGEMPGLPFPPGSPQREFFERFFGDKMPGQRVPEGGHSGPKPQGLGSGFIVDPEGYVVTNNHVIEGAETITVTLTDGTSLEAALVGSDPRTDLALLKVEPEAELPVVAFGDSDLVRPGDWVVAVGNPFGLGGTVTAGIVSARSRDLRGGSLVDFLQIDASINRGNSGGPSFNLEGEVIGINTAIFSPNGGSVGIGFAIPSNTAATIIDDLKDDGLVARGWLGVRIQPVSDEIAEGFGLDKAKGALVASVEPGSPAADAGLEAGDIVLAWDGKAVERFKDLSRLVAATEAGREVKAEVWRGRDALEVTVVTGLLEAEKLAATDAPAGPAGSLELPNTGLTLGSLSDEQREQLGLEAESRGVLVLGVEAGSPAAQADLRSGDVIASVALHGIEDPEAAKEIIEEAREEGHEVVPLLVHRQGQERFISLRIGAA